MAELVLRIIVGKPDLTLTKCETQADLKRVTGARSICLDAYAADSTGKKYDIEIQRSDNGADPHRARYHSSVMDVENLDKEQDYRELPDTYVIFITEKDYYKAGKPVYVVQNINLTLGLPFEDGTHILYVNGEYRDDTAHSFRVFFQVARSFCHQVKVHLLCTGAIEIVHQLSNVRVIPVLLSRR